MDETRNAIAEILRTMLTSGGGMFLLLPHMDGLDESFIAAGFTNTDQGWAISRARAIELVKEYGKTPRYGELKTLWQLQSELLKGKRDEPTG